MFSHSCRDAWERERATGTERDMKWLYDAFKLCLCIFAPYLGGFSSHQRLCEKKKKEKKRENYII